MVVRMAIQVESGHPYFYFILCPGSQNQVYSYNIVTLDQIFKDDKGQPPLIFITILILRSHSTVLAQHGTQKWLCEHVPCRTVPCWP